MTEKEYLELERRIAERDKVRAMAAEMTSDKKEKISFSRAEALRAEQRGETPWGESGGGTGTGKIAGGAFERMQIQFEG